MAIKLEHELVVLSEGIADKNFLTKLCEKLIPEFRCDFPYPTHDLGGVSQFSRMLQGLRGNQVGFRRLSGIVIIADSGSSPANVFADIQQQISHAGAFPLPAAPSQVTPRVPDYPAIAVMLIPEDNVPGGLESLCNAELLEKYSEAAPCVEHFLKCEPNAPASWTPEKLDKARFHSFVASNFQHDPSRALSYAFKEATPQNPTALLKIDSGHYNRTADRLRAIFKEMMDMSL